MAKKQQITQSGLQDATRVTGIAPLAMRTGSLMTMGLWPSGLRPSMTIEPRWSPTRNGTSRCARSSRGRW